MVTYVFAVFDMCVCETRYLTGNGNPAIVVDPICFSVKIAFSKQPLGAVVQTTKM